MGLQGFIYLAAFVVCAAASGYYNCPTLFNFYPDANDCTKFYRCFWGKPVPFDCPYGTRWSQHLLTCDHADNVPCGYNGNHIAQPHDFQQPAPVYHNNAGNGYNAPAAHNTGSGYNGPVAHNTGSGYNGPVAHNAGSGYNTPDYGSTQHGSAYDTAGHGAVDYGSNSVDGDYNGHTDYPSTIDYVSPADYTGHTVEPYPEYFNNYNNDNYRYGHPSRYNNDYQPQSDLFRAGYGYKKIYHKK